MAYSIADYTGDGVTAYFPIPFPYGPDSDIQVLVDGVTVIPQSIVAQLVYLPSAPASGAEVTVRRHTSIATPSVDFEDGAMLTEKDLDRAFQQILYAAQESLDTSERAVNGLVVEAFGSELIDDINQQIDTIESDLTTAIDRITATEEADGVHDTDITTLQTTATQLQSDTTANSEALVAHDTRITSTENSVTSQGASITQLINDLADANGDITANLSAINGLITSLSTTDDNVSANTSDIAQLQIDIAGTATSGAINALDARVTVVEGDTTSQASDISQLQTDVAGKASSDAVTSLDSRVTVVEGQASSTATDVTNLTSTVGDNSSDITSLMSSVDGLNAQWEIKSNVNGLQGGVGFYNDGADLIFAISQDGVNGLIYNATQDVLNVNGGIYAESIATDVSPNKRIEILALDNEFRAFWDRGDGTIDELVRIGNDTMSTSTAAIQVGNNLFTGQGMRLENRHETRNALHTINYGGGRALLAQSTSTLNREALNAVSSGGTGVHGRGQLEGVRGSSQSDDGVAFHADGTCAVYNNFTGTIDALIPKASVSTGTTDLGKVVMVTDVLTPSLNNYTGSGIEVDLCDLATTYSESINHAVGVIVHVTDLSVDTPYRTGPFSGITVAAYESYQTTHYLVRIATHGIARVRVHGVGGNAIRGYQITNNGNVQLGTARRNNTSFPGRVIGKMLEDVTIASTSTALVTCIVNFA